MLKPVAFLFCIFYFLSSVSAQEKITTFGFVIKPIFPSSYFRTSAKTFSDNGVGFTIDQRSGFSAGGVIRKGITKTLSFETGINYVKRLYDLEISTGSFTGKSEYKIVGYEIPVQALVFIQLSKEIWMDVALGPSLDMYPSDVTTYSTYFLHVANRNSSSVFNGGLLANLGWEYRTTKSGYIYIGACYHRSFTDIYTSTVGYYNSRTDIKPVGQGSTALSGDYLTFDIRYYFHEDPAKVKIRKKKK